MGRGVSCGGGQSSLGYLFGGGEVASANKTRTTTTQNPVRAGEAAAKNTPSKNETAPPPAPASASSSIDKNIAAGIHGKPTNNYFRAEGQNCGNFITDRPSTKVHSVPGGGSSLGYLFGGGSGGGGN